MIDRAERIYCLKANSTIYEDTCTGCRHYKVDCDKALMEEMSRKTIEDLKKLNVIANIALD